MTTHSFGASSTTTSGSSSATVPAPARSIADVSSRQASATAATLAVGPHPVAARSSSARSRASASVNSPKGRFAPRMNTCRVTICSNSVGRPAIDTRPYPADRAVVCAATAAWP